MAPQPLLLHSLTTFRSLLTGVLDAVSPQRICEIGSESGGTTKLLVDWARHNHARVWTVEPLPAADLVALDESEDAFTLVTGHSPSALAEVPACDAWLIDGDHNFWTVERELERAFGAGEPTALAILHDVAWPCARRDQYYDPGRLPGEAVRPHSWEHGVVPGDPGVRPRGGLRGEGRFAYALEEGGACNGVLTAVESVVDQAGGRLEHHVVPAVFGVGFVFPRDAPWAKSVRDLVAPHAGSDLLGQLEANRLALYLRVIELQDEVTRLAALHAGIAAEHERQAGADAAELARLRLERARTLG